MLCISLPYSRLKNLFQTKCYYRNKVNTFDLGSFLIKPVQRILKYPLLLQELLKLADVPAPGEDRKEYDQLIQAVKLMQEVGNAINEDKRRKDLGNVFDNCNVLQRFMQLKQLLSNNLAISVKPLKKPTRFISRP